MEKSFAKSNIDTILFTEYVKNDMLTIQIYVDDIIFYSINGLLCKKFEICMKDEFEMSIMDELNYFLRLQSKQRSDGIFLNQAMYIKELMNKFRLDNAKTSKTPMAKLDKNKNGKNIDIKLYRSMIESLLYLTASRPNICLVYVYVLDFNFVPKSRISVQ